LTRKEDPEGRTLPPELKINGPLVIGRFIPPGPPRFREGGGFQDWKLRERLGLGGFAEVWKVSHAHDEELAAAVKFFTGDDARSRLGHHEVTVLKQVRKIRSGKGIVQLLDFNVEADPPWIKFEYVPGGDLTRHAQAHFGPKGTALIEKLARIIGACHRLTPPVVHRDLKPGNILIRDGEPLIADFGIGGVSSAWKLSQYRSAMRPTAALPTILAGSHTAVYASPEQIAGADPDPRDDVYSLGVLWWQLLASDLNLSAPTGNWQRKVGALGLPMQLVDLLGECFDSDRPQDAQVLADRISSLAQEWQSTSKAASVPARAASPLLKHFTSATLSTPFVLVSPGEFWMGGGAGMCGDRQVVMEKAYYIGVYPVTRTVEEDCRK
jgi:serine/threonine protein kinase